MLSPDFAKLEAKQCAERKADQSQQGRFTCQLETQGKPKAYFNLASRWAEIVPLLQRSECKAVKQFILQETLERVQCQNGNPPDFPITPREIEDNCWSPGFLGKLVMATKEQRLALLDSIAWGKMAHCDKRNRDSQDYKEWLLVAKDEYDSPETMGHYLLLRECRLVALLVWTWCKLLWPAGTWFIVDTIAHTFVMRMGDPDTVYDILWPALGISASEIAFDSLTKVFKDPLDFYATVYDLHPGKTEAELLAQLRSEREYQLSLGVTKQRADQRLDNRKNYELASVLRCKQAFAWLAAPTGKS